MNDWGYIDPVQRVHEQRMYHPPMNLDIMLSPQGYYPFQPPVQSPLAGLDQAVPQIFQAAGYPRYENTALNMLFGAVLGGLLGRLLGRRRQQG